MKVTTKSGAIYDIENGYWTKESKGRVVQSWSLLWALMQPKDELDHNPDLPWLSPESWENVSSEEDLKVGKPMFISSKDTWFYSTNIISMVR